MLTISELKDLFEHSDASCVLYDLNSSAFFWEGEIRNIPLKYDEHTFNLYDANYETKQNYSDYETLFEICIN